VPRGSNDAGLRQIRFLLDICANPDAALVAAACNQLFQAVGEAALEIANKVSEQQQE
jgi:hypothetical protein